MLVCPLRSRTFCGSSYNLSLSEYVTASAHSSFGVRGRGRRSIVATWCIFFSQLSEELGLTYSEYNNASLIVYRHLRKPHMHDMIYVTMISYLCLLTHGSVLVYLVIVPG